MREEQQTCGKEERSPHILIVGGANTGRSAMAVALLKQLLAKRDLVWTVASAGVTAHEDESAEPEACSAMFALGFDIAGHIAHALDQALVEQATILLAVDKGISNVLRVQYPNAVEKIVSIGTLAKKQRDIPDPYRMQVSTWISYAKEMEMLLQQGLESLIDMGKRLTSAIIASQDPTTSKEPTFSENTTPVLSSDILPANTPDSLPERWNERISSITKCERLLAVVRDMPTLINWQQAQQQLQSELQVIGSIARQPGDLILSYTNLLFAVITLNEQTPTPEQVARLSHVLEPMYRVIDQKAIRELSSLATHWEEKQEKH